MSLILLELRHRVPSLLPLPLLRCDVVVRTGKLQVPGENRQSAGAARGSWPSSHPPYLKQVL